MNFVAGQRWLSHADTELGLGIVSVVEMRRVTVAFPATGEERTYASNNAPLSRIAYRAGDTIQTHDDQELTVIAVNELRGLLFYTAVDTEGREQVIPEQHLSARVQLTAPQQRLSSGQSDNNAAFQLRMATLQHRHRLQQSSVAGLLGARTSLLPHQLYIANTVAHRHAPRVLLADEVGLGKTIEAGLIIHQQLHNGRAARVLVMVPASLQHQWLVEMLRRFNLHFALFDAARLRALREDGSADTEDDGDEPAVKRASVFDFVDEPPPAPEPEIDFSLPNPFESEQLVLCSIDWLAKDNVARALANAAPWDLLVVDEAHHLHWSPQQASPEYRCVEELASRSAGLILLTATPEQAGVDSHFARLRLLDPARFHDLETFKREQDGYQRLNALVRGLLEQEGAIAGELLAELRQYFDDASFADAIAADRSREAIIQQLLDRNGTGRVLFRNTRAAVAGFPERRLNPYPLPLPELYAAHKAKLYPERGHAETQWLKDDARVAWLEQLLKKLRPAKVLIICAHADTAIALEQHLHLRAGIRCAAFHEGLTLIERDRASAWFAEAELGAQALVCSEIGSEGRNFQFAQHLVLFDLPLNPDLLEQRIGRLDRIGQGSVIDIHVPYFEHSAQAVLFRWFHEGLDLFRQSFSAGYTLYEQFSERLQAQLQQPESGALDALIADTLERAQATRVALQNGRDALLELNSCNQAVAEQLIAAIGTEEQSDALRNYMEQAWNYFGVDSESHSGEALILRPSEQLLSSFPSLPDDGITVSFAREQALSREDMEFLTWEHPMVDGVIDLILSAEHGNACVASISVKGLQPGTLLLEAVYTVHCPAPKSLQLERFLPLTPIRVLVDQRGKNLSAVLDHAKLSALCSNVPRTTAPGVLTQVREELVGMQEHAAGIAAAELPALLSRAESALTEQLGGELARITALRAINPAIRPEEIAFFERQLEQCRSAITGATLELQALRIVVNT